MFPSALYRNIIILGWLSCTSHLSLESTQDTLVDMITRPATALVVGANRGIGLQLVRTFSDRGWRTIGSVRPKTLAAGDPSIADLRDACDTIIEIDYTDEDSIKKAAENLLQAGVKLDVLVNSGGIGIQPQKWDAHEAEDLMERFQVMVVGPFLTTKHFLPLMTMNGRGRIIYITSDSGSIGFPNHSGHVIGYRMAKAAANQQVKTLAIDFKENQIPISTLAFEPGFIKTRLTGWRGTDDIVESCSGMVDIIENMTPNMSGTFLDWKGNTVPW